MRYRTVERVLPAHALDMGGIQVYQPLPTQRVDQIDPFLLLHHFGPVEVAPGGPDPMDVGPHPHRGIEPVTFLYRGGMRHHDSRGNTGYLRGGDVQWMTAGMGIIHSERSSKEFLEAGGTLEGIQLWVNLAPDRKMVQPRYQDVKSAEIPVVDLGGGARLRVVAGRYGAAAGVVKTHGAVQAWQLELPAGSGVDLEVPAGHNVAAYLLDAGVATQSGLPNPARTLLAYRDDGEALRLEGPAGGTARVLILTGEPIGAPVVSHGPYVMNSQTEVLQAMRDYGMGKMGFYVEE